MRRQLYLALALVADAPVVFLDEPTTGLDPWSRRVIWSEIRAMRDRGATVLLSTQQLDEGSPAELKRRLGGDLIELALADPGSAATLAAASTNRSARTV